MYLGRYNEADHGSASAAALFRINIVVRHWRGGKCAPTSRVKALDEFLDFPHLDVLFRLILTHFLYTANTRPVDSCGQAGVDGSVDERSG